MTLPTECKQNTDRLKLVRTGTTQEQRLIPALDPVSAPVDERTPAHGMVFAQAYAAYLKFFNAENTAAGDWQPFFSEDVSVQLAVAAIADVDYYRQQVREYKAFLDDRHNLTKDEELRDHLDFLFSCCATLAIRLNLLLEKLPTEILLKNSLNNLVHSQLGPTLTRLIAYRQGGETLTPSPINTSSAERAAPLDILGGAAVKFSTLADANLSTAWTDGSAWPTYYGTIAPDATVYGTLDGTETVFDLANHLATHNLFTSTLDQFLKAYAKTVSEAKLALEATLTTWKRHEPHYALFLAFLRLFSYARSEMNTLTAWHLDFYYRRILQLKEKAALPGQAHLLVELAKQVPTHLIKAGELFKAGKDDLGKEAFFANDRDAVINQAKVAALKTLYRHGDEKVGLSAPTDIDKGRLYASPVANSADGLGAPLTSADQSWHPFHNKIYQDSQLAEIQMPKAEVGFGVASHHLFMAEGSRDILVRLNVTGYTGDISDEFASNISCQLTTAEGWFNKAPTQFKPVKADVFELNLTIEGNDPPITTYVPKTHGYDFDTDLPILLIKLKHEATVSYAYDALKAIVITGIYLEVNVKNLKTLAVSNDFGPVDTSKPFQPYGASPQAKNALIIGSKEMFQKSLMSASVHMEWLSPPAPYGTSPQITIDFLKNGEWLASTIAPIKVEATDYGLSKNLAFSVVDKPDFALNQFYNTASRHGFVRLKLDRDFGQNEHQTYLLKYLRKDKQATKEPESLPVGPTISALWINYTSSQTIMFDSALDDVFNNRQARYFHLTPFGQAEQHPYLNADQKVYLLPQFDFVRDIAEQESEAEFYIGLSGLAPPQTLTLLFQVADGTADPLAKKPDPHLHWSYLGGDEWLPFGVNEVEDQTDGLLNSGIITFALPREAMAVNTLMPPGMHWLRAVVASGSNAVCRLLKVAAPALAVTFTDRRNDPAFPAKVLPPGTITKLDHPIPAVKKIIQPFPTYGGRGQEAPKAFYTRISERLRHKDRAMALWDYERLVLEAFPEIYQVKCLNHTHYEPDDGVYRELAAGHVTVVTIPDQQFQVQRDPFRPFTSLGLLERIDNMLQQRLSCFVRLHVKNPLFDEVRAAFRVRLAEGRDESFYLKKLEEDITRFLSPWAFPGGGSPSFGGKIYKAAVINFVEDLPYVDYVTDVQLFHTFMNDANVQQTVEKNEVEGFRAVSLLVSAKKHTLVAIQAAEAETPGEKCPCEP